ncbi:MAG: hypothetical protein ACXWD8_10525, partial [Mycobacterium sp.]
MPLTAVRLIHPDNQPPFDSGDYVELQMFADGQNVVAGKHIRTYDPSGGLKTDFTFPRNVANGQNQRTILISNTCPTLLEDADDTNNSATDLLLLLLASPSPRN